MNRLSIEPPLDEPLDEPPDEPPNEPHDEPLNEPPDIHLVFCFDPNPNVTNHSFCLDTNVHLNTNLDDLGSSDTYENLGIDPGSNSMLILALNLMLVVLFLVLMRINEALVVLI